jgi:protein-L-isoaspartate O-methyltransferase
MARVSHRTVEPSTVTMLADIARQDFCSSPPWAQDIMEQEAYDGLLVRQTWLEHHQADIVGFERRRYQERVGVKAAHIATIVSDKNATWMMAKMLPRIAGKVVVEIGAGLGVLAVEMARHAFRVFAIDSDPQFTASFANALYLTRPPNLTWIFDTAEGVIESGLAAAMKADVAVVVTGSDEVGLCKLAQAFVREPSDVIMPWQDWNGGTAVCDYRGEVAPCEDESRKWPCPE